MGARRLEFDLFAREITTPTQTIKPNRLTVIAAPANRPHDCEHPSETAGGVSATGHNSSRCRSMLFEV